MSYVFATPEWVAAAASDLASIGSTINAASSAAAAPTETVIAAGADDVSAAIAALFNSHAQAYQMLSQQAALFHQQFVELMSTGANQYSTAEELNTTLQQAGTAISAPLQALAGGSSAGDATGAAGAGDEQVLLTTNSGTYVQTGIGAYGATGGSSAHAPTGVPGAVGAGSAPLLPSAGTGVSALTAVPRAAAALPSVAAIEGPVDGLGASASLGAVTPVAFGQGAAGGAGGSAAIGAAPTAAGHSEQAANERHAVDSLRGDSGWLYGEHGLSANNALFGDGGSGGNGALGGIPAAEAPRLQSRG